MAEDRRVFAVNIPGRVIERPEWGAPAEPGGTRRDRDKVVGLTVHHTTGDTLGNDDTVRWWYNIWRWHTGQHPSSPLTWADIGYAYGVDKYGNVLVGRGRFRQLAHARGYNTEWLGIAYLGTGRAGHVTDEGKRALLGLRAWLRGDGGMVNMRRVNRHRDIGSTSCPGPYLSQWIADGMPSPDPAPDPAPEPEPEPTPEPETDMPKYALIPDHGHHQALYEVVGDTFYHIVNPRQRALHEKLLGRKIEPVELTVDEVADAGFRILDGHTAHRT